MSIFTRKFWSYAGERAIKTMAQAAVALIGTGSLGLLEVQWWGVFSASLLAGIISVLTSISTPQVEDAHLDRFRDFPPGT
ncbi:holin [Mycetocola saprophilus]|uniref:holin n=1 Tax=Mycetocola saprophilus TaxID=76636 RepID=UPI0004BED7E8|nr:holin [Mycetocola saprophilus]